ncbi:exodeoxyribonuclease V subunit alpha [Enterobacteriaceae bacterium LUAb1]
MSQMEALLRQAVTLGAIRALDKQFALLVAAEDSPARLLIAALLSADAGEGHVCLLPGQLTPEHMLGGRYPELAQAMWQAAGSPVAWPVLLEGWSALSNEETPAPLVLHQGRLYLQRLWQSEGRVAEFFAQATRPQEVNTERMRPLLDRLFGTDERNGQKVAAAVAMTRRVSIISGGPGTGKTTTVAKLLAALIQSMPSGIRIQMAAPTGKAAARLTESLSNALARLPCSEDERACFPAEATTLHRLLGAQPNSQRLRYHRHNPLHLDVLVVDEASMIDLPMMANLIAALPLQARVIFLGDRDQLASVEAGAVLGDLCRFAEQGYSDTRASELSAVTGCPVPAGEKQGNEMRDAICLLHHSYRFDAQSGIGQLAQAVNNGDISQVCDVFTQGFTDIALHPLSTQEEYQHLLDISVAGYRAFLERIAAGASPADIVQCFSQFRLLCALREGPFGVTGLNERVEQSLHQQRLIRLPADGRGKWYSGRPVMITRNDSALGLFNGDIGVALPDEHDELKVWFILPDGAIKAVQPGRLPPHETAWAMTVHKSQGSEFSHTVLVMPNKNLPILTRELVYTAITRARHQLSIYSHAQVFQRAVMQRTLRRSGLMQRI